MIYIKKLGFYYNKLNFIDFLRWLLFKVYNNHYRKRTLKSYFYFKRSDVNIGKRVIIKGISFDINLGSDIVIYDNCIFEFGINSHLSIGNSCLFSYNVLIQNMHNIEIGNYVQIGEYSSIRDTTHQYSDLNIPIKKQKDISKKIIIKDNVWIGKGCIILPDTIIEDGVIIGANSVVKGHLQKNCIYAGAPIRLIKKRG